MSIIPTIRQPFSSISITLLFTSLTSCAAHKAHLSTSSKDLVFFSIRPIPTHVQKALTEIQSRHFTTNVIHFLNEIEEARGYLSFFMAAEEIEAVVRSSRAALRDDAFEAAREEGRRMSLEDAVRYALGG